MVPYLASPRPRLLSSGLAAGGIYPSESILSRDADLPYPLSPPLCLSLSVPFPPSFLKIMQQQAALMAAAQGTCLNPMAAIAAAQMQQMAAFNVSGLVAAPLTPSSGRTPSLTTGHPRGPLSGCCQH